MGAVVEIGEPEDGCTRSCPGDDSASEPSGSRTGTPSGQSGRPLCDRVNPGDRSGSRKIAATSTGFDRKRRRPSSRRTRIRSTMCRYLDGPLRIALFLRFSLVDHGRFRTARCMRRGRRSQLLSVSGFFRKGGPARSTMTSATAVALLNGKSDAFQSFPASPGGHLQFSDMAG